MGKYLVTSALPYANGKLHIGHLAGAYLPADIFVRFLKLKGEDVLYICGTDEHGAPISIKAEMEKVKPKDIASRYHQIISKAFKDMDIAFDNFSGTARTPHHELSQKFFLDLYEKGYIIEEEILQFYCADDKRFLADRYVEGTCPYCGKQGARGDQCDSCGKLIDALSLINPKCKLCGSAPEVKKTKHWFLDLPAFVPDLKNFLSGKDYWKNNILKFILGILDEGLIKRSITRDIDWGVPVPIKGYENKVLYVWFDAPIGYISSTKEYFKNKNQEDKWKEYWQNEDTKVIHFIGKDNNIFHAIIWPAILLGQKEKYNLPFDIPANEYLNLEGRKLSTSQNWAIWVDEFLNYFDSEYLRFYLARISPENKDADFLWSDFGVKINNELVNIIGNLINRVLVFADKYFEGKVSSQNLSASKEVLDKIENIFKEMEANYFTYQVRKNTNLILDLARIGNKYFDETAPWKKIKEDKILAEESIFICCCILQKISIALYPILPKSMLKLRNLLNLKKDIVWEEQLKTNFSLEKPKQLFRKIEDKEIEYQINLLQKNSKKEELSKEKVDFSDFEKLDIKLVKIVSCQAIAKSKKILKLKVKYADKEVQVLSGIAQYYKPEELIGKKVVMICNLKPRNILGEVSNGMLLTAEKEGKISLLTSMEDIFDWGEVK